MPVVIVGQLPAVVADFDVIAERAIAAVVAAGEVFGKGGAFGGIQRAVAEGVDAEAFGVGGGRGRGRRIIGGKLLPALFQQPQQGGVAADKFRQLLFIGLRLPALQVVGEDAGHGFLS